VEKPENQKKPSIFYALFVLCAALSISGVAAYYSVVGLIAIFSGAALAIAIMGSVLEVGKLVTASWLYRNWKITPWMLKTYLTIAVIVLMFVTSMGIFGFLSKAHLSQINPVGDTTAKIERIEFSIAQHEKRRDRALNTLKLLDDALAGYYEHGYITRGLKQREEQKEERIALQAEVTEANKEIDRLASEKFSLETKKRGFEAEVGPIKYVAELIYGQDKAKEFLDEAVRGVIIVLIFVFDPLAILLVIAGTMTLGLATSGKKQKESKKEPKKEEKVEEPIAEILKELQKEEEEEIEEKKSISLENDKKEKPKKPSALDLLSAPNRLKRDFSPRIEKNIKNSGLKKEKTIPEPPPPPPKETIKYIEQSPLPVDTIMNEAFDNISKSASCTQNLDANTQRIIKKEIKAAINRAQKEQKKEY